jgi:hypothetical protein
VRLAAAVQLLEAVGALVAVGFAAAATIGGRSYQTSSGAALTVFAVIAMLAIAILAYATAKSKPWSRSPALIVQLFMVLGGIMLIQGQRLDWGIPMLILGVAAAAALLTPASLKALNRPDPQRADGADGTR